MFQPVPPLHPSRRLGRRDFGFVFSAPAPVTLARLDRRGGVRWRDARGGTPPGGLARRLAMWRAAAGVATAGPDMAIAEGGLARMTVVQDRRQLRPTRRSGRGAGLAVGRFMGSAR